MNTPLSLSATRGRPGQSLTEVIVATALFSLMAAAFLELTAGSSSTHRQAERETAASLYAAEGLEAARSIAKKSFADLADGAHGLDQRFGVFAFSGSQNTHDGFTRTVTVSPVAFDEAGQIVDPYAKSIVSTVTWTGERGQPLTVALTGELTDYAHPRWLTDLTADFSAGSRNSTAVTANGDGDVRLDGLGDLHAPQTVATVTLPSAADSTHAELDPRTDRLYVSTLNNTGGAEFFSYDASSMSNGTLSLSGSTEIGDASNAFAVGRDYVFALSDTAASEVRVIRKSDLATVSSWNLPSSAAVNDIAIDETAQRAYVVADKNGQRELYEIDISNPLAPSITITNQLEFNVHAKRIALFQGFAFVATNAASAELHIVNLATFGASSCNLAGNQALNDIVIENGVLYAARASGAQSEFTGYAINPAAPDDCAYLLSTIQGQAQLPAAATDIALAPGHGVAFVLISVNANELQIVDLATFDVTQADLAGSQCDAVAFSGKFLYAGCRDDTASLQVWTGAGAAGFPLHGTYTSPPFDSGKSGTLWEQLYATKSGNGGVSIRIRTADTSGNLKSAPWVGSDGTQDTAYAANGWQAIVADPGATGTRWMQWKATLTGSGASTPVLEDTLLLFR